jgi:PEP-CTERM motif
MRILSFFISVLFFIGQCRIGSAEVIINWAGTASLGGNNVTGAPDGHVNSLGGLLPTIDTSNFVAIKSYNNLESLLGVPFATLSGSTIIAWEDNGSAAAVGGGWESTQFTLNDTLHSITINHVEGQASGGVIGTGSVSGTAYDTYFGLSSGTSPDVMSWILLDNPANFVNIQSNLFTIRITAGSSAGLAGEGTPDIESIGVLGITAVPEPSTMVLLSCIGGFAAFRRFRKSSNRCAVGTAVD